MRSLATLQLALAALLASSVASAATISLGGYAFDDLKFGDALIESDGGAYRSLNWLNVVNTPPGSPGALTDPHFLTGLANLGYLVPSPTYTITYTTPISNSNGSDLGIVSTRASSFPPSDADFTMSVSTDGTDFSDAITFTQQLAVSTGIAMDYYYAGGGFPTPGNPFDLTLYVTSIDLSLFGLGSGAEIQAVRILGLEGANLMRVAGFAPATIPEPSSGILLGIGLAAFATSRRRRVIGSRRSPRRCGWSGNPFHLRRR